MKNINKIIESDFEISDKCSWWYDTQKNIVKRYTTGMWVPISGSYKKGYLSGGVGIDVKTDEELINIKYNEKQLTVNNKNQLELNGYTPLAKKVRWCRNGFIDLDRKEVCVVPARSRCAYIRFCGNSIRDKFKKRVEYNIQNKGDLPNPNDTHSVNVTLIDNSESQVVRDNINFNYTLPIINRRDDTPFKITWTAKNVTCNRGDINIWFKRYNHDPDGVDPKKFFMEKLQELTMSAYTPSSNKDIVGTSITFTAIPYITIMNPFTTYGGQVIIKDYYTDADGQIVVDIEFKYMEPNTYIYDVCNKNFLHFNEYGVCDKGSFLTARRFYLADIYGSRYKHINCGTITDRDLLDKIHNLYYSKKESIRYIYGEYAKELGITIDDIPFNDKNDYDNQKRYGKMVMYVNRVDYLYNRRYTGFEEREKVLIKATVSTKTKIIKYPFGEQVKYLNTVLI